MKIGIDASNVRAGGSVTHLVELLSAANPLAQGFSQVIVWSGENTLKCFPDFPWLVKKHISLLDKKLPFRIFWQRFLLSKMTRQAGCDVLFVPGGSYAGDFHPFVTMSRNMLPFEWQELCRYGWSWMAVKLLILRWIQAKSFQRTDGLIFLTQYARDRVLQVVKGPVKSTIIPHGIHPRFFQAPRNQHSIGHYSEDRPFRIVYVSIVTVYKHQWNVVEAVSSLRASGVPVTLELIGPSYPPALVKLHHTLEHFDPSGTIIKYVGPLGHALLPDRYAQADLCVFASSCENMPNILLEGMASGLPIACSGRGPMPEVLGDAGLYFNPEVPEEIANTVRKFIMSSELREEKARAAFERVQQYSWKRCADETFQFLSQVVSG